METHTREQQCGIEHDEWRHPEGSIGPMVGEYQNVGLD
jgi:hypothetical protein